MKIAIVQKNYVVGDLAGNAQKIADGASAAAQAGAELAVFSELCLTGYPPQDLLDRPAFVSANQRALSDLATRLPIPAIVGFVDRVEDASGVKLHNAAGLLADGELQSVHHKSLLPTYDVFDERRHFEPAPEISLATLNGTKIGISICEDIWNDPDFWPQRRYPESPIDALVELGAEILINLAASPFTLSKRTVRPTMLAALARKHSRPIVAVNQIGGNDELLFDGASVAISADGEIAAQAREFAEDLLTIDVTPAGAITGGERREIPPHDQAGDMRAALAGLTLGTRDYAHKCGFKSAVVGLSGGIDSAVTAAIAARALGADAILGIALPSRWSSDHSLSDAEAVARNLGIAFDTIPIAETVAAFSTALAGQFGDRPADVTEENLQARSRAVLLMALSNKLGHLLLTTGNKSEVAVGYCTLYGDMSGGLAVISDVPKTMVYHLAHELNRQAGREVIPQSTLTKPPSAELRPDQVDQDSLPPYETLDQIIELHIEEHLGRDEIIARGFAAEVVEEILRLVYLSEYKRRQAAPGLKLTSKAFGLGRRMPIASRWRG